MPILYDQQGVVTTRFYPKSPPGTLDLSSGNVPTGRQMNYQSSADGSDGQGGAGSLPALWWLGILIIFVALRVAYEYA